jgi:chemotaxis protein methyltransferase CheR
MMKNSFESVRKIILNDFEVDLSMFEKNFLFSLIEKRMEESCCNTVADYSKILLQNKQESKCFIDSLYIGYSEFFRDPLTFATLERIVLPEIISQKRNSNQKEIRIWSTACSAGHEVYSLAMLLEEMSGIGRKLTYRIFATDCSESQLTEARKGEYSADMLSFLSFKRVNQWFTKVGDIYAIKPVLKENIDFSEFNMLNDKYTSPPASIFGDFDLVVCANLLFYYKPEFQNKILEKASGCLKNVGYIVSGETERDILMRNGYREVFPQSAIFKK